MNVIFLDIDGVLNSDPFLAGLSSDEEFLALPRTSEGWFAKMLAPENVSRLNALMNLHPEARIVVSSTWCLYLTEEAMKRVLTSGGFLAL